MECAQKGPARSAYQYCNVMGIAMLPEFFNRTLRMLILLGSALFAQSASATFHLWELSELYSDASGTVQYIELSTSFSDQQFLSGHAISASQGSSIHIFNFPANLPGDTAGREFLIGTQGFADLGIVTPDYIVPNGFLFLTNGSVNFADVDVVNYSALPTDGVNAINRNGVSVVNAPTNFAGATGSVHNVASLLTVTLSGTGTVTSSTGSIDCGLICSGNFSGSVTLTATPASGRYFAGWSGDCAGTGSCIVTMSAAKNVNATFKPVPFVANTSTSISATSATIATTLAFNAADVGKQGAVYVTGWVPVSGLNALGISAATDTNTFVLVQLTATGWQLLQNGQLVPYTTGGLGDAPSFLSILNNTNPANLLGAQFCAGYGTSATEMITAGRMMPVAIIPDANSAAATNGSCNVTDVVVEFYNTDLDHYFITADANEAAAIDNGSAGPGWSRTGNSFRSGGNTSVCRFYGSLSPGPNSHFYTVDAAECAGLKQLQASTPDTEKRWNFESLDFVSTPPVTGGINGVCPSGTAPVYRAYNNGFAKGIDSNHRITSSLTAIQQVVDRGWINEGVVMCAPQ